MELRHLRYFVAVAEEENVSRAAAKLRVSQPAVGRQVRDLEAELGFPLLTRTGKSVRLTAAGRIFFGEAREVLAHAAAAVEKARGGHAQQAELHIGYLPSGTAGMLSRTLRVFKARFSETRVILHDLFSEEMQPLLLQKKLDVALTVLRDKLSPALAMRELESSEACVAVGVTHPLARAKFIRLEQVAAEPVATLAPQAFPSYHRNLQEALATVGCQPCVGSEHDSGSSLIAAVAAGTEWALVPRSVRNSAGTRLKFLKLRPALPPWTFVALWHKDAETVAVRTFVDAAGQGVRGRSR